MWVGVSLASGRGHRVTELTKARVRCEFDDLVHVCDCESVFHIPFQEWRGEQDLIVVIITYKHFLRTHHDGVLFGVPTHEGS